VSDPVSGPNWFPQPPPKPLKAPSAAKLALGSLPAVAVVGAVVWMSGVGHSGHKPKPATPAASEMTSRQAFAASMKSMGANSGFRFRGRFGGGRAGGSSNDYRSAFEVCRSLLRPSGSAPAAPPATGTTPAPVA
jgi:hypothetical protein